MLRTASILNPCMESDMALSKAEQYLIYDTSLQLLQQDLLTNTLFQNGPVGRSLRDMVLSRQPVQPLTNPYDEAITGSLRADSRTTMQNSRNVTEAASMVGIAEEGVAGIQSALEEMQGIIADINSGKLDKTSTIVRDNYNDLKTKVLGYISNTEYNGIHMLDSTKWGTDQISSSGAVHVQAFKDGGFNVQFQAVNSLNFAGLSGADLANDTTRADQNALLSSLHSEVSAVQDMYASRQESLTYQAERLKSQSGLLDQAVEARRQTPTATVADLLLDLVLKDSGSLLDQSS